MSGAQHTNGASRNSRGAQRPRRCPGGGAGVGVALSPGRPGAVRGRDMKTSFDDGHTFGGVEPTGRPRPQHRTNSLLRIRRSDSRQGWVSRSTRSAARAGPEEPERMGLRGVVGDLLIAAVAGYAGTKVMEPASMALYKMESSETPAAPTRPPGRSACCVGQRGSGVGCRGRDPHPAARLLRPQPGLPGGDRHPWRRRPPGLRRGGRRRFAATVRS